MKSEDSIAMMVFTDEELRVISNALETCEREYLEVIERHDVDPDMKDALNRRFAGLDELKERFEWVLTTNGGDEA